MTLKNYLTLMIVSTLAAAICFGLVINLVDPYKTNQLGFWMFYGSFFATILGIASIFGFILRFVILRKVLATKAVIVSFRQAFLMSFLVIAVFAMFAKDVFSWLNFLLMVIGFSALEFFLLSLTTEKLK
ncbi:MAG: hypothetical protein PHR00_00570 [Patescibacteria group bacterium]|nr:hypothetical protein [Patescibacteria group bacterium]